jgi:ribosome biogenesis GTPase A
MSLNFPHSHSIVYFAVFIMPRSKAFSGKQKREQLKTKRANKREDDASASDDDEFPEHEDEGHAKGRSNGASSRKYDEMTAAAADAEPSHVPEELLTTSLGKSGKVNRFSTVFAREDNASVDLRRYESADVLDLSQRGKPWIAHAPLNDDPVLQHPRGVLLRSGKAGIDKSLYLREDTRKLEEDAFSTWLDAIYARYTRGQLNHFEHSMEVWMQLWHTLASSDVICIVADVRNPLWHIPHSLYHQVVEELKKPLIIILNKIDLVSQYHVDAWVAYLKRAFSAAAVIPFSSSSADLSGIEKLSQRRRTLAEARKCQFHQANMEKRTACVTNLLSAAGAPPHVLESVAESLFKLIVKPEDDPRTLDRGSAALRRDSDEEDIVSDKSKRRRERKLKKQLKAGVAATKLNPLDEGESHGSESDVAADPVPVDVDSISVEPLMGVLTIGMVGHPNAGKSSVINSICTHKKVSVSRTAGHTKRAQTVPVVPGLNLLDCPGLVFPHALVPQPESALAGISRDYQNERAMQEILGVIPIAQVREPYTAIRCIAEHLPLERMYGLALPKDEVGWSALLICECLATKRGLHIARVGRPDAHSAGREILYDSQDGILPLAWLPPPVTDT